MKDIAIYGAGGFGKEVACLIERICYSSKNVKWRILGFFDDGKEIGSQISHFGKVIGGINELNNWDKPLDIVIAIGNPKAIRNIYNKILNPNINFPNIIDPSFYIVDHISFSIGKGNIIQGLGSVSCDTIIGNFNVLNGGVVIGHDTKIGDYNVIMPGSRISGEVIIGDCNFLGVHSVILQQMKIGNNVTLGAGSVMMTKPKDGGVYIGVPAKRFKF